MSNISQDAYEYLNKIREFPTFAIPALEKKLQYFKGNVFQLPNEPGIITNEGEQAIRECIKFLEQQKPLESFKLSKGLSQAAQDHAYDLGTKGIAGHQGTDGSTMGSRIERYGKWTGKISEIISYGSKSGQEVVLRLLIDDGNLNRGNRSTCFNMEFKQIGVGTCLNDTYGNMCVLKFAESFTPHQWFKEKEQQMTQMPEQPQNVQAPPPSLGPQSVQKKTSSSSSYTSTTKCTTQFDSKQYESVPKEDLEKKFEKEEIPENCVSLKKTTESETKNGKKYVKITKVFTMKDGSEKTVTEESFSK